MQEPGPVSRARASESRKKAGADHSEPRRRGFLEPAQRVRHLRVKRAHHWLAIVPAAGTAARPKKGAYCDDGGISCQFSVLEHVLGGHGDPRMDHHVPAPRKLNGLESL